MKNIDSSNETVTKIVESATELFNLNGYSGTSIGDISKKAELSKGILYHYFKDKDALYLHCVTSCVETFLSYMDEKVKDFELQDDIILKALQVRLNFFDIYPQYRYLLNNIISLTPHHLSSELAELKSIMRESNLIRFKKITKGMKLGNGITDDDIMTFLTILQNNAHFVVEINNGSLPTGSIDAATRMTKIFINGLKEDIE